MKTEHKPLSIHLKAKAKHFNFKFKANTFIPACYNFFHFSLFLKIYSLVIRVGSDNNNNNNNNQPTRRKSFKSRIRGFIERFRSIPTNKKTVAAHKSSRIKKLRWVSCEGPICGSTVVIGNLALLIQSFYEKDVKGMIVHCFSILLYILSLLKTFIRIKYNKLLLVSMLLMVGYPLWLYMMHNPSHRRKTFVWRYMWKTWKWAASHPRLLNAAAQFYMKNDQNHGRRTSAWRYIWKTWNWAASHGLFHAIA